jgi:exodeoxyribonuclease VII small subunit
MARKPSPSTAKGQQPAAAAGDSGEDGGAADLTYSQARTALELVLAELQTNDLDVEAMAGLYRRGQAYAQRCEAILEQVEQEVLLWDGLQDPEAPLQSASEHIPEQPPGGTRAADDQSLPPRTSIPVEPR